jgi:sugar lactone lactonase YvrE
MRVGLGWVLVLGVSASLVSGCGSSGTTATPVTPYVPPAGTYAGAAFGGKVMAGALPVIGASVQLYEAGTTGNGSAATQLLANAVTTDATGSFSIAAGYTCALSSSVVFVVSTGGKAGASGVVNSGTVLMSSPGACSAVTAGASYVVNEVTTVAGAYAFAAFLKAGGALGASSTNAGGLTLAAGTLANLVNLSTGAMPGAGFPATGTAPVGKIGSLADALNACIVSSGAGSAACSGLYAASVVSGTPPSNTLDAAVGIAQHPGVSATGLYTLGTASTAYAGLSAAPADWTLLVTYGGGGMNEPTSVALDSKGRVWVANYNGVASLFTNAGVPVLANGVGGNGLTNSYGAAVDASDNVWITNQQTSGTVSVFTPAGVAAAGSPYQGGGMDFPTAISFDANGTAWVANFGDATVTLLNASGTPLSGPSGYSGVQNGVGTFAFPVAVAVDSKHYGWVANQSGATVTRVAADGSSYLSVKAGFLPSGVAIDGADNVWVANFGSDTVTLVNEAGTVLSSAGFTGGGLDSPQGIAVDGAGTVWVSNNHAAGMTELAGASSGTAGAALSPSNGWAADSGVVEAYAVAIDAGGNLWVSSFYNNTLTEYVGMAVPVKTPLVGPVRVP